MVIPILDPSLPPTTADALHALTILAKYVEALLVSSLHLATMCNTFEVSDISSLQTIVIFSQSLLTEQPTATDFA